MYRRSGKKTKKNTWVNLIKKCEKRSGIIVAGNFNAHHTLWNCGSCNDIGEGLLEEVEDRDLYIVNSDTLSRIENRTQRDSNLDLMFCTTDMMSLVDYQQLDDPWDSNHLPLAFHLGVKADRYVKKTNRITTKKPK